MHITPSLAHGVLREAILSTSKRAETLANVLARKKGRTPPTFRRFDEWFRVQRGIHEKAALLIVFGMVGRRRGAFSAFLPQFKESDGEWELDIKKLFIQFSPGCLEGFNFDRLQVTISGHALERMFQRTDSIHWAVIRDCLASATLFLNAAIPAYVAKGCKQCVIPAGKGLLVGHVTEGELRLRTFLPNSNLQPKWQSMSSSLGKAVSQQQDAFNAAVLISDEDATDGIKRLLDQPEFKILHTEYFPGVDRMEAAWRSKETPAQ